MKTVIIDDEPNSVDSLKQLLEQYCPEVTVLGTADNANTGRSIITSLQPDLVFLDIEMPYGNAFEMLNSLGAAHFEIIFITAFNNYAIDAFRYSAMDYILKPVNIDELQHAVKKAAQQIELKTMSSRIDTLLHNLKTTQPAARRLALPTTQGFIFVNTEDILRLEASGNYTFLYLKTNEKMVVSRTLKEFEEMLDRRQFTRVHHSHIINHHYIKKYYRGRGGFVEMEDNTTIEVSIRKKDEFLSKFSR